MKAFFFLISDVATSPDPKGYLNTLPGMFPFYILNITIRAVSPPP